MEGCWGLGAFGILTYPHFTDEETEAPRGKAPAIVTQLLRGGTGVPRTIFLTPESLPFCVAHECERGDIIVGDSCRWKSREQDGAGCHLPQLVVLSDKTWGYPTGSSRVMAVLGGPHEWCISWPPL